MSLKAPLPLESGSLIYIASRPSFVSFDPGVRAPRACMRLATSIPGNLSTAIPGGNPKKLDSQSLSGVLAFDAP